VDRAGSESRSSPVVPMRLELILLALFFASWLVGFLQWSGLLPKAGSLDLGLRGLFSLGAALGWLSGNVYVQRSRGLPAALRRRIMLIYLLGPPGLLFLLRSLAPAETQMAAPLAPLYATLVMSIFFFVPVSLKGAFRS
jgi:hypothetical protein